MSNKFQKSVLERLEQEARQSKGEQKAPIEALRQVKTNEPSKPVPIQARREEPLPEAPQPNIASQADLSAYLRLEPARQAKNKTFYLDLEIIEAIKAAAKVQGVTDSKIAGDILRYVLLNKR